MISLDVLFKKEIKNLEEDSKNEKIINRLNNIIINKELKEQIEFHGVNWYRGFVNAVLCVESNGEINRDNICKSKRKNQKMNRKWLKGLRKVYINLPMRQSVAKRLHLESLMIDSLGNIEIIENNPKKLLEDLLKLKKSGKTLKKNREENLNTGAWLIYGLEENTTHYLIIYEGIEHSCDEVDEMIYKKLKNIYAEEYLLKFLKSKV